MSSLMNQNALKQNTHTHTFTWSSVCAPVALPLYYVFHLIKNDGRCGSKPHSRPRERRSEENIRKGVKPLDALTGLRGGPESPVTVANKLSIKTLLATQITHTASSHMHSGLSVFKFVQSVGENKSKNPAVCHRYAENAAATWYPLHSCSEPNSLCNCLITPITQQSV